MSSAAAAAPSIEELPGEGGRTVPRQAEAHRSRAGARTRRPYRRGRLRIPRRTPPPARRTRRILSRTRARLPDAGCRGVQRSSSLAARDVQPRRPRSRSSGRGQARSARRSGRSPIRSARPASTEAQAEVSGGESRSSSPRTRTLSTCTSSSRLSCPGEHSATLLRWAQAAESARDFAAALKVYRTFVKRFPTDPLVVDARQKIKDLKPADRAAAGTASFAGGNARQPGLSSLRALAQAASAALAAVTVVVLAAGCGGAGTGGISSGGDTVPRRGPFEAAVRRLPRARRGGNRGRDRTEPRRCVRGRPRTGLRGKLHPAGRRGADQVPARGPSQPGGSVRHVRGDPLMPPNLVTGDDVDSVAAYVASVAGVPGAAPPPPPGWRPGCGRQEHLHRELRRGVIRSPMPARRARSGRISTRPSRRRTSVVDRATNGEGAMPPFKGTLTDAQIQAVADYVASAAGST